MATVAGIEVIFREANHDFSKRWSGLSPSTQVLSAGWTKAPGRLPLREDLIFEKDLAISLRDGVRVWADIFRPLISEKEQVPAIIAWSPYGKQGNGRCLGFPYQNNMVLRIIQGFKV
jgi:predicted acyl esterase